MLHKSGAHCWQLSSRERGQFRLPKGLLGFSLISGQKVEFKGFKPRQNTFHSITILFGLLKYQGVYYEESSVDDC